MKKEDLFFPRRTKPGKKNEEFIWIRKIFFLQGEKIISRGKRGKYLEKEKFFAEEKNNGEGKGGPFARG